ncbi:hypothetical protein M378DRAFT_784045 [Amanita muscaria Koide BX008]|uniref:DUF1753-domain-containing protein n=1 Tax=Amanita muscaria (strain Koide BX008) TaxID=946122 RepID=A0A0C2XK07_AMAMK|nr:hypothetical protein M378DRAFT_784045 [Amanita muscaria Koide BX008]
MKLMLRPEWRLWPFTSLLGVLDIKTGVTVALLFALLNKVAGVYGLIAVITGAGGSFAQLSLYIYSVLALIVLAWGLQMVKEEDPRQTFNFSHFFLVDHLFSSIWTVHFAINWWAFQPHDGRRQANSPAQEWMIEISHVANSTLSPAEREVAAMEIWQREKGTAAFVIIFSWLIRLYFVLLMYSYAVHLRKGSYRTLPLSRSASAATAAVPMSSNGPYDNTLGFMDEDEEIEDFYRVPIGVPSPKSAQYRRCSARAHKANSSISSFTDFVSAPGRPRKPSGHGRHDSQQKNHIRSVSQSAAVQGEIDALFDEEESTAYTSTSPRSRLGTEAGSSTATSDEERTVYSDRNKLSD